MKRMLQITDYKGYEIHREGYDQYTVYDADSHIVGTGTYTSFKDAKDAIDDLLTTMMNDEHSDNNPPAKDLSSPQVRSKQVTRGDIYQYSGNASYYNSNLGYFNNITVQARTRSAAITKIKNRIASRCNISFGMSNRIMIEENKVKMI